MLKELKRGAVPVKRWNTMTEDQREGRFPIGVLVDRELPRYLESYRNTCDTASRLRKEGKV
jgi:2-oxoglutarate ferredoxin oxidoreductase subunit beta